jgi:mannosyl-oligosaccharide glucosidase
VDCADLEALPALRDTCEQDDGMQGYGWTLYDDRAGGSQIFHDSQLHMDITTDFTRSKDGMSWGVRVVGTPRADAPTKVKTALIFHTALEQAAELATKSITCSPGAHTKDHPRNVEASCNGTDPALGLFEFFVLGDDKNHLAEATSIESLTAPEDKIWQAKGEPPRAYVLRILLTTL